MQNKQIDFNKILSPEAKPPWEKTIGTEHFAYFTQIPSFAWT
jgi:hypothetical protein